MNPTVVAGGFDAAHRRRMPRGDLALSVLGFGGAAAGRMLPGGSDADVDRVLEAAWARGLRYFDTSPWYGRGLSEHRLGRFLRQFPRPDFVLSSKVGRLLTPVPPGAPMPADTLPFDAHFDYSYDGTMRSVQDSLQRLGLSRIDMLIVHDLSPRWHGDQLDLRFAQAMDGAHRALCELRAQGVVRAIGVGVNDVGVCLRCLDAGDFDFFMLAGRMTLLDHEGARQLLPACLARGVSVLAAAPYNSGILATGAVADARYFYAAAPPDVVERTRAIGAICDRFGVPLGAAALQFALGHAAVTSVVPSCATEAELAQAIAWLAQPLPGTFWQALREAGLLQWVPSVPCGPGAPEVSPPTQPR